MSRPQVTLKLVGPDYADGLVDFETFVRFCDSVIKCLHAAEDVVGTHGRRIHYQIKDLEAASAKVTIEAKGREPDTRRQVVSYFKDTLLGIQRGKVDPRMPSTDLEAYRELAAPFERDVKQAMIGGIRLQKSFGSRVDALLKPSVESRGAVSGKIERVNIHKRNEMVLYPPVPGHQIVCVFKDDMLNTVQRALGRQVTVAGTLRYRPGNGFPDRVQADEIEIHPLDKELPTLHDVRRLGSWGTEGLSAVEFVERIRDEQSA